MLAFFDPRDSYIYIILTGNTYFEQNLIEVIITAFTCFLLLLLLLLRGAAFGYACRCSQPENDEESRLSLVGLGSGKEPKSLWEVQGVAIDIFVLVMSLVALVMHGCNILGDSVPGVYSVLGMQQHQLMYQARIFDAFRSILLINAFRFFSATTNILFLTIWKSLPRFFHVLIVWVFILLVFGIVFVELYRDQFDYCDLTTLPPEWQRYVEEEVGVTSRHHNWLTRKRKHLNESATELFWYKENCTQYGGEWKKRDSNFDNLHSALLTLFHMSTMEGWVTVMRYATDRVGVGIHPIENHDSAIGLTMNMVYILMIILSSNLFVSAFVNSFDQSREELEGWSVDFWVASSLLGVPHGAYITMIELPTHTCASTNGNINVFARVRCYHRDGFSHHCATTI